MLGREMEMQVPHSAFDVSAITAAPQFLHGPMKIFCTEPAALAGCRGYLGWIALKEGGLARTTPNRPVLHFLKEIQGVDQLLGAAGTNRGQVLREILMCLGSLSKRR